MPRTPLRPTLKWAGGKRWLVPQPQPLWHAHAHRRIVEPFCGGLSVAIALTPARALLNDLNPHVINFYRWLQQGLTITTRLSNNRRTYYALHTRFNTVVETAAADSAEAAGIFYYLNRTAYNGLCRFNRSGAFNVPFGRYKRIGYRKDFADYVEPFARFEFRTGDVEAIPLAPGDFVCADPPYDVGG